HLPHSFHATTAAATLIVELFIVWFGLFPTRWSRVACLAIVTPLQIGIIVTANYAFLNYLVLALGVLLLDQRKSDERPKPIAAGILIAHFVTTSAMFLFPNFPTARLLAPTRIVNNFGLFAVMTRARSARESTAVRSSRGDVAVLVHDEGRAREDRRVVESERDRHLRAANAPLKQR